MTSRSTVRRIFGAGVKCRPHGLRHSSGRQSHRYAEPCVTLLRPSCANTTNLRRRAAVVCTESPNQVAVLCSAARIMSFFRGRRRDRETYTHTLVPCQGPHFVWSTLTGQRRPQGVRVDIRQHQQRHQRYSPSSLRQRDTTCEDAVIPLQPTTLPRGLADKSVRKRLAILPLPTLNYF